MSGSIFILFLASFSFIYCEELCGECRIEDCYTTDDCKAGVVYDRCGCCKICAKEEFELCDHIDVPPPKGYESYGTCGENLECTVRNDLPKDVPAEALCQCKYQEMLCGNDGISYENICQLAEATVISKGKVIVQSKGPCKAAPKIESVPENISAKDGTNVALICEASGHPIPTIEWVWTRVDNKTFSLPNDDINISVNQRGGPERRQITGWLQIQMLNKQHEGDYTCIVQNEQGFQQSTARINVDSLIKDSVKFRHSSDLKN